MEGGEKRKRREKEKNEEKKKKSKVVTEKKEEEEAATEEEVEEFFAILKRMQVSVKYFGEGWREAAETAVAAVEKANEDEDNKEEISKGKEESSGFLDLNAEPKGDSGS